MHKLSKIYPGSVALYAFLFTMLLGLLLLIPIWLFGAFLESLMIPNFGEPTTGTPLDTLQYLSGALFLVVLFIQSLFVSAISALFAFVYNLVAKLMGGIRIELDAVEE